MATTDTWTAHTLDLASLQALARRLAATAQVGDLLLLDGPLGAGKTTFVQALVAALGDPSIVSSPTFTLINEYRGGRLPVAHLDLYRLDSAAEIAAIGLSDYLEEPWLVVVEWAEKGDALWPPEALRLRLTFADADRRNLVATAQGPRARAWLAALAQPEAIPSPGAHT